MILFLIKKAFFDMWDNLFSIILMNLGFILLLAIPAYAFVLASISPYLAFAGIFTGVLILYVYAGAVGLAVKRIADYQSVGFGDFWNGVKASWPYGLALGGISVAHYLFFSIALPFYSGMQNIVGLGALVVVFWASLLWVMSSLYYFPLLARIERRFPKLIKKCFILFFDNAGFTLALGIGGVVLVGLSVFTAFLLPGMTTVLLWLQVGFKLRLLKYDYLEANPNAPRNRIPWDELLLDERERVGKRTLKGMIFPWKE